MPTDEDIYAPPEAQLDHDLGLSVIRNLVVGASPLVLPDRCVRTGEVDVDLVRLVRKFTNNSPFKLKVRRHTCLISYCLERETLQRLNMNHKLCKFGSILFIAIGFAGLVLERGEIGFSILAISLLGAVVLTMVNDRCIPLKVVGSGDGRFRVKGCSRTFLAALEDDQEKEIARRIKAS